MFIIKYLNNLVSQDRDQIQQPELEEESKFDTLEIVSEIVEEPNYVICEQESQESQESQNQDTQAPQETQNPDALVEPTTHTEVPSQEVENPEEQNKITEIIDIINQKIMSLDDRFQNAVQQIDKLTEQIMLGPNIDFSTDTDTIYASSASSESSEYDPTSKLFEDKILESTFKNRTYGFIRSKVPPTVLRFEKECYENIPESVDLRSELPTVYDQGKLGSCTSNAIAGAFNYYIMGKNHEKFNASRLFIYFNEREIEG